MDVMMGVSTEDVRRLRAQFTRPLRLEAFVALLQSSLRDRIHSELDFVVGVIELFHTIDVNGDGELDWDEFAAYMMDAGVARTEFSVSDEMMPRNMSAATTGSDGGVLGAKQYAPLELPPRDPKTPLHHLKSHIQQLVLASDLGAIAYFEADSDVVYLYSLNFDRNEGPRHLSTLRLHTAFQEHVVIGIEYVPNGRRLLVTSSVLAAGFLSVWSLVDTRNPVVVRRFEAAGALELPVWLPTLQCIAVSHVLLPRVAPNCVENPHSHHHRNHLHHRKSVHGSTSNYFRPNAGVDQPYTRNNQILLWDLSDKKPWGQRTIDSSAISATTHNNRDARHSPIVIRDAIRGVTSLVVFKWANRPLLAIGREDGVISVVDAEEARDVHEFDAHGSGVKALAYSDAVDCLASAGFFSFADETTLDVLIWKRHASTRSTAPTSPTIGSSTSSTSSSLSMKMVAEARLEGHEAPVELLAFVDSKSQLVTADRSQTFLVFSSVMQTPTSESWECLQRFSSVDSVPIGPRAPQTLWSMLVVPPTRASDAVMITAGDKLRLYDHCQVRHTDEGLLVFNVYYCSALNVIVGATSAKLMLWRADTGVLWKSYDYSSIAGVDLLSTSTTKPGIYRGSDSDHRLGVFTAMCVDDRERKLIVGDDAGTVRVVNAVNGNVMKRLDPHSAHSAVVALAYVMHGKRVISISAASELHICDEDQPAGYYVPFGGAPPESVLLQSLRFVYKPPTTLTATHSNSDRTSSSQQKFSIVRAVANLALDTIAVLVHGSKGESFVQLWDFELRHALGTCILPSPASPTDEEEEEITAVTLLASSGDIVGGTSCGRVLLWPDPGRACSDYNHILEFPVDPATSANGDDESGSMRGAILFLSALAIEQPTVEANNRGKRDKVGSSSTIGTDTASASSSQRAPSLSTKEWANIFLRSHSIDARVVGEQHAGVFVVAGDDRGFVSIWVVALRPEHPPHESSSRSNSTFMTDTGTSQGPTLPTASIPVPTADQLAGRTRKRASISEKSKPSGKKSALQHTETVVGFDTVAALYQHAKSSRHKAENARSTSRTPGPQAPERLEATLMCRWRAHDEPIASLEVASDPCVVLTSSSNGKIKVWSLMNALLGVIDQRATRRAPTTHPWSFPVDMADRRRRQELEASRYLANKARDFTTNSNSKPGPGWKASLRCSVLQDRLSLTDHELLELTHPREGVHEGRRAHHRPLQLRQSDVGRAVRNFVLMQAAPTLASRDPKSRPQLSATGDAEGGEDDQPLHTVLKEVEQYQLADGDKPKPSTLSAMTTVKDKRPTQWPMVTLASVKALAFSSRPVTSGGRVHCEFPALPSSRPTALQLQQQRTSRRQQERYAPSRHTLAVTKAEFSKRREVFVSSMEPYSNQSEQLESSTARLDRQNGKAPQYLAKLAHSWSPPPPRRPPDE